MRIVHTIPQFPYFSADSIVGGAANALWAVALEQAQSHEVTILSHIPALTKSVRLPGGITLAPLAVPGMPGTIQFGLASIRQSLAWLTRERRHYDLVHGHSGFLDYLLTARLSQLITGKPALHSLYCPIALEQGRHNRPLYKLLLKRSANGLAALTAFSRNVQQSLQSYGVDKRRIHVTLPAIDLKRFYPAAGAEEVRAALGLAPDDFVILFVGNTKPAKNLSALLQAFYEVRQRLAAIRAPAPLTVKLIVTTELKDASADQNRQLLAKQMDELGLEADVMQLGIIDNMPGLMRASDVLVAPFLDTFGPSDYFMAALEAMACGKPVIVSPVGGMPEIVDERVGLLVNPHEPTAIAAALQQLALAPEKRRAMGAQAAQLAQRRFAPAHTAHQFEEIYRSIL